MPAPADLILNNATLLNPTSGELLAGHLRVEGGRIKEVAERPLSAAVPSFDLAGKTVMPGLCDAHVHVIAATADLAALRHWPPSYVAARAGAIMRGMLARGFTTVRDAGGADFGLAKAVEEGYLVGPRLLFSGRALSQTGGHGDLRGPGEHDLDQCFCCAGMGRVCDGVTEVRRACREEIRQGATQIKLMVSGGVASPTDRIDSTQFSDTELRAAVEEADAANIPVMAHAYTARAINRALDCGVTSIEHGNLLDDSSIERLLRYQAFLVPTLSTYRALAEEGIQAGLPEALHAKVFTVLDAGISALERANKAGVNIVYGTDLLGAMQPRQLEEFAIRSEVQTPLEIIRSATVTAARLFRMEGEIGVIAPGARADLLVLDGNPLDDLAVLQQPDTRLLAVLKDGVFFKNAL